MFNAYFNLKNKVSEYKQIKIFRTTKSIAQLNISHYPSIKHSINYTNDSTTVCKNSTIFCFILQSVE